MFIRSYHARHEQVSLMRLRFERYFSHYRDYHRLIKHIYSWRNKRIILWALNRQKNIFMYGNISRYQKINLLKIWFFCVLILRKYLARYFQSLLNSWFFNDFRQEQCKQNTLFSFVNFVTWDYMTLCSYHVKYAFQSESTLYSCLNVKEFLARNARNSLLESSRNSLLTTQLNHLPSLVK